MCTLALLSFTREVALLSSDDKRVAYRLEDKIKATSATDERKPKHLFDVFRLSFLISSKEN